MYVQTQAYSYILIETDIIDTDIRTCIYIHVLMYIHSRMQILSSFHTLHKPVHLNFNIFMLLKILT